MAETGKSSRSLEEIEKEISEVKSELMDVHGTETEVYARIVGYYRAVKHWNKGKKDEYYQRKMFTLEDSNVNSKLNAKADLEISDTTPLYMTATENPVSAENTELSTVTYEMYTRKTCPNCPPVKEFMAAQDISGRSIDVDTKEGLAEAAKKGIFASPTVIFYNQQGIETARCHNVEELEAVFQKEPVNS